MSKNLSNQQSIINQRNQASLNTIFAVSTANSLDSALQLCNAIQYRLDRLKQTKHIEGYLPIATYRMSDAEKKIRIARWKQFWTEEKKASLLAKATTIGNNIGFDPSIWAHTKTQLNKSYTTQDNTLAEAFHTFLSPWIQLKDNQYTILTPIKIKQEKRKQVLELSHEQHISLIDKQLIASEIADFVKEDFNKILWFTSIIVFLTLLISYGRIELALITFLPMAITWLFILGLMGLLHIEFNIINIIIATLIFGLGDDFSLFTTDSLLEKYKYGIEKARHTRPSILLSALATVIGLGTLLLAKHPALQSIALVSVIGILSILFVSQTVQPLLFNFFIQCRADKKFQPFTLFSFIKTIIAFTLYVTACYTATFIGLFLIKLIPFQKKKLKYAFHKVLSSSMGFLLYTMANTKQNFLNKPKGIFDSPKIFIANHSSFLDLLRIISLHPKLLLLTNKWVWYSPIFGALVRLADYYPVAEGAEMSVDKLKEQIKEGYSIAIFPEGTRSYDDKIKRFRKGAFFLAEQFKLPIVPIVFHGISYTMQKGDFLLKNGEVNAKFLNPIEPNDERFGTTLQEKAKHITAYFRNEYDAFKKEREDTHYFREQLIKNYVYKGPVLEWYCKIKTKLEHDYEPIEKLVPKQGSILDIGCGYGFLDYILAWTSVERTILSIDFDKEKIDIANHCFLKNEQIEFLHCDALAFPEKQYDCIIMLDVLHYFTPDKQALLIEKIIANLSPNGVFIFRDGFKDIATKHKGTQLSEYFSTQLFKFNKTSNDLHFIDKDFLNHYKQKHNLQITYIDQTKFTSNLIAVIQKK
ncbi:MAG: 1-acyl-sn-glycerol-3-phosphate acyltransferase [Chitinophagaceae bacterium]